MSGLPMERQKGLPNAGYGPFLIYPPITINNTMGWYGLSKDNSYRPSTHTHTHASMAGSPVPQYLLIPCSPGSADPLLPGSPVFTLRRCPGQHYLGGAIGCPFRTLALSLSLGIVSPNDQSQQ